MQFPFPRVNRGKSATSSFMISEFGWRLNLPKGRLELLKGVRLDLHWLRVEGVVRPDRAVRNQGIKLQNHFFLRLYFSLLSSVETSEVM